MLLRRHREKETEVNEIDDKNQHDGLTIKQIKEILDSKGVQYDAKAKKDELLILLEGAE